VDMQPVPESSGGVIMVDKRRMMIDRLHQIRKAGEEIQTICGETNFGGETGCEGCPAWDCCGILDDITSMEFEEV